MKIIHSLQSRLDYYCHKIAKTHKYLLGQKVLAFLQTSPPDYISKEEKDIIIEFLKHHLIGVFNYPFAKEYTKKIKFTKDRKNGLYYMITKEGHRMYMKRGLSKRRMQKTCAFLEVEQHQQSPHNYCFEPLAISSDTVIADIGSAEGNFGLKFIDKIKKLYLFEVEPEWIEALEATFEPWKDKVVIVNRFVGNKDDAQTVKLDTFFNTIKPTLLKIDVEGAEKDVFAGAERLIRDGIADVLCCTYHRHGDDVAFTKYMEDKNYKVTHSQKFMLHISEYSGWGTRMKSPIDFRRGLIHATPKEHT